uniref:Uncharacterized protein n=1 Tax=Arundo donax TaxID=35708 RepID=A0A0A9EIZ3_ARUDO
MAFQSASLDEARAAMADWTREESSCRSSTWSVSLSSALLCCCKSFESTAASPSGAPAPAAAAAVWSPAAPIAYADLSRSLPKP